MVLKTMFILHTVSSIDSLNQKFSDQLMIFITLTVDGIQDTEEQLKNQRSQYILLHTLQKISKESKLERNISKVFI